MESVSFDGVTLTDFYEVMSERGAASVDVQTVDVSGRDGRIVRGATYGGPKITLVVAVGQMDRGDLLRERRRLSSLFSARTPRRLQFGDDDGLYYMAVPTGEPKWTQYVRTATFEVALLVPSPAMYGKEVSVTVPSGGTAALEVGGTYPTMPRIVASSAVRNSSSGVWGVRLDEGDFMHVVTGSSSSRALVLDCAEAACTVAGSPALMTLDSDWLELEPGHHALRMDQGTGAATVTWTERWLA